MPREGTQQTPVQFPLSHHTFAIISSSQSDGLQSLSVGDSEAADDPGGLWGKLGLLGQVAATFWKGLKMAFSHKVVLRI